jgi:hypothetical protein
MSPLSKRARSLIVAAAFSSCLVRSASGRAENASAGAEFRVNTVTGKIQQSSALAMGPRGDFVVAWQSEIDGRGDEIRARRFDACGVAQGEEFPVNALSQGNQDAPSLAMDAQGSFVVVWQSFVTNHYVIRARRFDAAGVAQGGEIPVDTRPREGHNAPAVAMAPDGRFVVAWESAIQGSYEIRARRFDSQGVAQGGEFPVNTVTESSQRFPAVAMDGHGNFAVVWRSNVAGSFEIRSQRFAASGAAEGGEIAVNAQTAGDQLAPSVAMGWDGSFVVVWENSFDGGLEVRARRFSALGIPRGAEFPVSAATAGNQFSPAVAMNRTGAFAVVWHDQVGASSQIRGRTFASRGGALGPEIDVNGSTAGVQKSAAVALDGSGNFVVSWHSDAGDSWDIIARTDRLQPRAARTIPSRHCNRVATEGR